VDVIVAAGFVIMVITPTIFPVLITIATRTGESSRIVGVLVVMAFIDVIVVRATMAHVGCRAAAMPRTNGE
jgi:hypothetical protein